MSEKNFDDRSTIDELFQKTRKYQNSTEFLKFVKFMSRFQHYSRLNSMLVYIQNEAVTFFGGTGFWKKKFDRTVKEDARPYIILAPNGPTMLVYDIFETEGELSPEEFLIKGIGENPFELKGNISPDDLKYVIENCNSWGIEVIYKPLSFFNAGYIKRSYSGHPQIFIKEGINPEMNFAVLIHELGHLLLGHLKQDHLKHREKKQTIKLFHRELPREAEELEAETVSYLVCKKLGLETRSADYLSGYLVDEKLLELFSYELVIRAVEKIESTFLK